MSHRSQHYEKRHYEAEAAQPYALISIQNVPIRAWRGFLYQQQPDLRIKKIFSRYMHYNIEKDDISDNKHAML